MKAILFCLFLVPLIALSQEKKDSKIIVSVTDTANLFNRLSVAFIEKGYSFENKDQQLGFISTTEKRIKGTPGSMKIRAIVKDSVVAFTGTFALDVEQSLFGVKFERTFDPVLFSGDKNGSNKVCWREIESIAKQFGKLTYSR